MRSLAIFASMLCATALAGSEPQYPNTEGIQADFNKPQLIEKAKVCIKTHLKNEQFELADNAIAAIFGVADKNPVNNSSLPDPSALVDSFSESGKVFGKHVFATKGFFGEAIVTANATIETKDGKFRIIWSDAAYSVNMNKRWRESQSPLIQEALPYKQAMTTLSNQTDSLVACMLQADDNSNW